MIDKTLYNKMINIRKYFIITKKILLILLSIILVVNFLIGCSKQTKDNKKQADDNSYHIGLGITYEMFDLNGVKNVNLKISHESDSSFNLEIGLLKNFKSQSFSVKQGEKYIRSNSFLLKLDKTNEELCFSELELQLNNCNDDDNLIIWVANRTTFQKNDVYGYRFIRLTQGEKSQIPKAMEINLKPAKSNPNYVYSLYATSVSQNGSTTKVEFIFEPQKLYDGGVDVTNEDPDLEFDFLLIALHGNKLIPFNNSYYMRGSIHVTDISKFNVSLNWIGDPGETVTFLLIPYPYLDYDNSEHLQKILYNNCTHFTVTI
ncbi:MAG: hypothetical protein ACLUH5_02340 [Eubacterium sp.]